MSVNRQDTEQRKKLVMTNEQAMIDEIHYGEPVGRSDHLCIDWTMKCYVSQDELDTKVIKYFFEKADYEEMRDNLGIGNNY